MKEEGRVLVAADSGISVRSFRDISEALSACTGAKGLILTEGDLAPEFFDLRSGLAGELFQKFINYRLRVAIVLPDPGAYGERFAELAREHASHSMIRFVRSVDEAKAWLYEGRQQTDTREEGMAEQESHNPEADAENEDVIEANKDPEVDWFLRILVSMANSTPGVGLPIVLTVRGLVISGELISGKTYHEQFAQEMGTSFRSILDDDAVARIEEGYSRPAHLYDSEASLKTIVFIHLRNAKIFGPGQQPIPSGQGMLWRGRLSSVDGFSWGQLRGD